MISRILIVALLLSFTLIAPLLPESETNVLAAEKVIDPSLSAPQPIHTESRFETKLISTVQILDRTTTYKDDPEAELDTEQVLDEGADGKKTIITKIAYYEGKEYSRDIVSTEVVDPKPKIVSRGTKIVWRTLDTPDGQISYWRKLHVWATQYDSHCPGCDDWTAIGMHQGKGVIAVDPSVIKLRSQVYIPGYGKAVAGDTGGAIKGNIIDVGFPDAHTSGWMSHFVDIYLIN